VEYIQCQHCRKRYAVSDKLRAAAGRKIRCKHCQQVFEIVIRRGEPADAAGSPEHKAEEAVAAPEMGGAAAGAVPESGIGGSEAPDRDDGELETAPKKNRIQLLITIILSLLLIAAAGGAGLFFYKPELFRDVRKAHESSVIPTKLVDPMRVKTDMQKGAGRQAGAAGNHQQDDQPSQACKDAAAEYWLRTRVLKTTKLETNAYMQLLEMNLEQAEQMRQWCQDEDVVSKVSEAARAGTQPAWISEAIKARLPVKSQ